SARTAFRRRASHPPPGSGASTTCRPDRHSWVERLTVRRKGTPPGSLGQLRPLSVGNSVHPLAAPIRRRTVGAGVYVTSRRENVHVARDGGDAVTHFVFVESRDPYDSADCQALQELAAALAGRGHPVTLFLVQNGVLPARAGARLSSQLTGLVSQGVRVLADDFALRE